MQKSLFCNILKPKMKNMSKTTEQIPYSLEYIIHASPQMLFNLISTASGLSEWFCNDVNIKGDIFEFKWDDSNQFAQLIHLRPGKSVKFKWLESPANTYFEFKIKQDELTKEISLIINDFSEEDETEDSKMLWDNQIENLMHKLGNV